MLANTQGMFIESLFILCPLYIWVGFMGGAAYVNVMHNILELEVLEKKEKEIALVLSLIFNDTGVLLSAIFTLVADQTWLLLPEV